MISNFSLLPLLKTSPAFLDDIKLLILIPCRGTMREELAKWLSYVLITTPFLVAWDTHHGRPEDDARNGIVERFLQDSTRSTHLMMIDDDIIPPPNALQMVLHGKAIVSAVVFTWKDGEPLALLMKWDAEEEGYKQDKSAIEKLNSGERLVTVDATGTGCFVAKREVYENLITNHFRFQYDSRGRLICGEDFDFYQKVKKLGYSVWVDGAVICGHVGQINILEIQQTLINQQRRLTNENYKGNIEKTSNSD